MSFFLGIDYIESQLADNESTKTDDFLKETDKVTKIQVIEQEKNCTDNTTEEEGVYYVFYGAPKTSK